MDFSLTAIQKANQIQSRDKDDDAAELEQSTNENMEDDLFVQEQQETFDELLLSVTNDSASEVFPVLASTSNNEQGTTSTFHRYKIRTIIFKTLTLFTQINFYKPSLMASLCIQITGESMEIPLDFEDNDSFLSSSIDSVDLPKIVSSNTFPQSAPTHLGNTTFGLINVNRLLQYFIDGSFMPSKYRWYP